LADRDLLNRIEAVRRFNRFYTTQIGVLREGLLDSPYSLTEARIIYEMAHRGECTATALRAELGLDRGYLSRLLRRLAKLGLVEKRPSPDDGRQSILSLTEPGQQAFQILNSRSRAEIAALLGGVSNADQFRMIGAMETIEALLAPHRARPQSYLLRLHEPGDIGWVIHRHGTLYAEEFGWNQEFETLVAEVAAGFLKRDNAERERCWIAEMNGEPVGSGFVMEKSKTVAQLRLMLVDPKARGMGIGAKMVDEALRFARRTGYRKISLWTNSNLLAARTVYRRAGFQLIESSPHRSFGHDLVGEIWQRDVAKGSHRARAQSP